VLQVTPLGLSSDVRTFQRSNEIRRHTRSYPVSLSKRTYLGLRMAVTVSRTQETQTGHPFCMSINKWTASAIKADWRINDTQKLRL
jgi:hypothetical protein